MKAGNELRPVSSQRAGWLRRFVVAIALVAGVALHATPLINSSSSVVFGQTYTASATSSFGPLEWALGTGSTATGAAINPTTGRIAYSSVGTVVIRVRDTGDAGHPASAFSSDFTVTITKANIGLSLSNLAVDYDGNPHAALVTPSAIVSTIAGDVNNRSSSDDGVGTAAHFVLPVGIAVTADGTLYVTDNFAIRKISTLAQVTTLAGTPGVSGAVDATGASARFGSLRGLVVDGDGNLLVADATNHVIRKVTPAGVVSTFAGLLGAGSGSANGLAANARFNAPTNLALGPTGDVYIAEYSGPTIRKISSGTVSTIAGLAGNQGGADGTPLNARFGLPTSLARDSLGRYYVTDQMGTVRRIETDGSVVTVAGAYQQQSGTLDGPGATSRFVNPWGIVVDAQDNVYVSDFGASVIRKISPDGLVTTIAGSPGHQGSADGSGSVGRFANPVGLAIDSQDVLYAADLSNGMIRRVVGAGGVLTVTYNGSTTIPTAAGSYNVLATLSHANWEGSASGTLTITAVSLVAPVISSSSAMTFGDAYTATINNSSSGFGAVQWALSTGSTAAGAAINSSTGAVTTTGVGKVVIKARFAGDAGHTESPYSADFTITVGQIGQPPPIITSAGSFVFGNAYTATANTGVGALSWELGAGSTATGAAINATTGAVTATSVGTVVIKARFAGNATHSPSAYTADYPITVNGLSQSAPVISSGNSFTFGSAYSATANSGFGALTWALGTGSTAAGASINSSTGAVATTSTGTVVIKARFAGDSTHSASAYSADFTIAVGKASQSAPVISSASSFPFGSIYTATGNTGFGALEWSLGTGSTATAANINSATGVVSCTSVGSVVIKARFAGDSNHLPSGYSTDFVVLALAPLLKADFNQDGGADVLWQNAATGERRLWLMNGTSKSSEVSLGSMTSEWHTAGSGDFNSDGHPDLVWQNTTTGERGVWLMNGTGMASYVAIGTVDPIWNIAEVADFNHDRRPDLLWENSFTGERGFWLMNGMALVGYAGLGIQGIQWNAAGAGDFNRDGKPDILWQNSLTGERKVWLMNDTTKSSEVSLGFVGLQWVIGAVADYNGDGSADVFWQDTTTGEHAIWLMNGTTVASYAFPPSDSTNWVVGRIPRRPAASDFNRDGKPDIVWQNTATGDRKIWWMNGTALGSEIPLSNVPTSWQIAGTGDLDNDGRCDIVWQNTATGERGVWLMNGTNLVGYFSLGTVSLAWQIVGTGDFNADNRTDVLWQNTSTGERGIWLMNGTELSGYASLGAVSLNWQIAGIGDFNRDDKPDIIWQNSVSGDRKVWLMNGTVFGSEVSLGNVALAWQIAGVADYNLDGQVDILWQNTATGESGIWLMNGTTLSGYVSLGVQSSNWQIAN